MAPSRGKGKTVATAGRARPSRRSARPRGAAADGLPDVYSAMLTEVQSDESSDATRPLKRRRVTPKKTGQHGTSTDQHSSPAPPGSVGSAPDPAGDTRQTIEVSTDSEGSEFDFEDVDIDTPLQTAGSQVDGIEDLSISVQPGYDRPHNVQTRRKPATTIEKSHRLVVHKLHILCLLGHCMYINGRCNNTTAQKHLRSILSSKTISYLNPPREETQFQRNRSFIEGLEQAVNAFVAEFRVNATGLTRPHWNVDGGVQQRPDDGTRPTDGAGFVSAAQNLEGSQDLANQLFCAMLRSVGVNVRIVCSLQPLPFSNVPKAATPKKPTKVRVMAIAPELGRAHGNSSDGDAAVSSSRVLSNVPSARRRLGQPSFAAEATQPAEPRKESRPALKLSYPVFWAEAFNEAHQKWVSVDPMFTHTINKPSKLEPPISYDLNQMTYVIGFESDGSARDVTRRYAKAYNAKTRRHRVEASVDGSEWWNSAMRVFRRRGGRLDRDQVEDSELAQKEAREGLPGNVLDFKDHPYYALKRHLKRHEVIHPMREVGKVNAGTAAKPKMESVFRRRDVLSCKSADKWYRAGREIKAGEQPLKHVPARAARQGTPDKAATTALYAPYQTKLYVPPPVQRGRIPKNAYGNLDIYASTMIPAGGAHVRHALAQQAARLLCIDYADAVTGFQFKGRHGTAIIEGAVVADQFAEAVHAVIDGLEYMRMEDESISRSIVALRAWKRFVTGLRIAKRVRAYGDSSVARVEDNNGAVQDVVAAPDASEELLTAGRYSLNELTRKKTSIRKRTRPLTESEEGSEVSLNEHSDDGGGGFIVEQDRVELSRSHPHTDGFDTLAEDSDLLEADSDLHVQHNEGGGFITHDTGSTEFAGGFLQETDLDVDQTREQGDGALQSIGADDLFQKGEVGIVEDTGIPGSHEHVMPTGVLPSGEEEHVDLTESVDEIIEAPESTNVEPEHVDMPNQHVLFRGDNSSEEESDKGSLLSHDPDDDEAEPDWLESD